MTHFNAYDHFQDQNSRVHQVDPRVKVLITFIFILSTALLPDGAWGAYLLSWLLIMGTGLLAGIRPGFLITRSFLIIPFLLAAVTVIFTLPGEAVWTGPFGLTISDNGLLRFSSIFLRSWVAVQMAILLTATTRFPDILHALRHLKVPATLVSILAFMYRYLFVMADEASRLLRARAARSAQLPGQKSGRSLRWRGKVAGNLVGQLFIRSLERSDRVYQAMLARGYRGELLTMNPHQMVSSDWLILIAGSILVLLIQGFGRLS